MSNLPKMGQGDFEDEIAEESMLGVMVAGNQILLSRIGGKIYAMDTVCSHYFGYLPRGELRDLAVVCAVHKAQYDIVTRKVLKNVPALMNLVMHREATDLRTYEVEVVGNSISVKV